MGGEMNNLGRLFFNGVH